MSFIGAEPQDSVGLPLSLGRPTLFSHVRTSIDTTLYDLPLQNIERSIALQHAGQNFNEIPADEANEKYGIVGHVKFDKPIAWRKAELINKYKRDELERFEELELGNDTLFRKTAFFATAVGAQALDPINLAAMFIPVVGEAKFAALVTKVGLTKARLIAGAAEAVVGQAMVEPMAYLSKAVGEQNIYSFRDTVANVTAGTLMGVGLRVGGGRVKDVFFGKYNARQVLESISQQNPKARLNTLEKSIVKEATDSAQRAGLEKNSPEWKEHVLGQVEFGERVNAAEVEMLQAELRSLSPTAHRAAFEEGMNNLLNDEPFVGPSIILQLDRMNDIRAIMKKRAGEIAVLDEATTKVTDTGNTQIEVGDAKVEVVSADGALHVKIIDHGTSVEDVQGVVYQQAKIALETGQTLYVDDVKLEAEALDIFVNGPEVAAKTPKAPEAPANIWDDVEVTPDHVNTSTAEARSESSRATADEINAAAEEIMAAAQRVKETGVDVKPKVEPEAKVVIDEPEAKPKTTGDPSVVDEAARAHQDAIDEMNAIFDEHDVPADVRDQILDDFDAPERLADEQSGLDAAIDCVLRNLL